MKMKKLILSSITIAFLAASSFAASFSPSLHLTPSTRQLGFGGLYTTDVDNFYGIYANPATLGRKKKHALFPSIYANVGGPLADTQRIVQAFTNLNANNKESIDALSKIIAENNGLNFGMNVQPILSFGAISAWGLGWAFDTQVFANGSIPGVTLADVNAGVEATLRLGFGFPLIYTDNHKLSIGATAKGFAQGAVSYNGSLLDLMNNFQNIPLYMTAGFGFDVGAIYTLCNTLDIAATWYDCFSMAAVAPGTISKVGFNFGALNTLPSKLAVGAAFHIPVDWSKGFITSFVLRADYRNVFALFDKKARNPILEISAGAELVLGNIVSFRFGLSEMYPAVGVGFSFGVFKMDFAMYGKELGLEPGSAPCLNASALIGFNF